MVILFSIIRFLKYKFLVFSLWTENWLISKAIDWWIASQSIKLGVVFFVVINETAPLFFYPMFLNFIKQPPRLCSG